MDQQDRKFMQNLLVQLEDIEVKLSHMGSRMTGVQATARSCADGLKLIRQDILNHASQEHK